MPRRRPEVEEHRLILGCQPEVEEHRLILGERRPLQEIPLHHSEVWASQTEVNQQRPNLVKPLSPRTQTRRGSH